MDTLSTLETGEKYSFVVPEIGFEAELPFVLIPSGNGFIKIASLNLLGMIEWNRRLGEALAQRIRRTIGSLEGVVFFSAVEKSLQLGQVVCQELGIAGMAIAYNRRKPHMETEYGRKRPFIQVACGSVTSGDKYLLVYERDVNLLSAARRGIVLIDDVVSTGGTIAALATIIDQVAERRSLEKEAVKILGIYCVAKEGEQKMLYHGLSKKIYSLGSLPPPRFVAKAREE